MIESYCGIVCSACKYKDQMHCEGCVAKKGRPFWAAEGCEIALCCQQKGIESCGFCPDFPCDTLRRFSEDPKEGDEVPGARIEQCRCWACKGKK